MSLIIQTKKFKIKKWFISRKNILNEKILEFLSKIENKYFIWFIYK